MGEDIDLLVLTVGLTSSENPILFLKSGKGDTPNQLYSSHELREENAWMRDDILVAHAFTGCDSTSAIYGKGKLGLCKCFQKGNLQAASQVFIDRDSSKKAVAEAGNEIFSHLYEVPSTQNLNDFQFMQFEH